MVGDYYDQMEQAGDAEFSEQLQAEQERIRDLPRNPNSRVDYDDPETKRLAEMRPSEILNDPDALAHLYEVADEEGWT